jgi:cytochrome P450|tara:strand:- start:3841 stop:5043 length:1203 start_codon:yes stop_codon:yes gene_type:complete
MSTQPIPDHVPADRVVDFNVFAPPGGEQDFFAAWKSLLGGPGLVWTTENGGHWIAAKGEVVRSLWGDAERFSNEALAVTPGLGEVMEFIPLQQDPPEHKPFRMAVMKGFANNHVVAMEPLVREQAEQLIDGLLGDGGCEFMSQFAEILPIHVFLSLIGVPPEDRTRLRPLGQQLTRPDGSMTVVELRDAADAYLEPYIRERLTNPGADLFSRILSVPIEGRPWTFDEAQRMCRNLLFGGLDTVVAMMGNMIMHLARHPDDQAHLREDASRIPAAVDELMRRYPTVSVTRNCVETTVVDGVEVREGDLIYLPSVLHNLDPACFDDPEKVDFDRGLSPVRHTTLGVGPHRCVGAGLARLEAIVLLEEWLARVPSFSLAEDGQPTFRGGNVGSLLQLELRWAE